MNPVGFYSSDPWLEPFSGIIESRIKKCLAKEAELAGDSRLMEFAMGHFYYGLHRISDGWVFREYAPNAEKIFLTGVFSDWKEKSAYRMNRINQYGDWEIILPFSSLTHGDLYKLSVHWDGGGGERIPSYATRLVQDDATKIFSAQVWCPEKEYEWKTGDFKPVSTAPVIYEAHIGMSTPHEKVGTYREFTENVLPVIAGSGYNTIQLMAIQEHPFYGSFGYHVSSFFAASSRFGTPEELKELIDRAHESGIRVIMDLVPSHSVKNVVKGRCCLTEYPGCIFTPGHGGTT